MNKLNLADKAISIIIAILILVGIAWAALNAPPAAASMEDWGGFRLQAGTTDTTLTFTTGRVPNYISIYPESAVVHFTLNGQVASSGKNPQVQPAVELLVKPGSSIYSITIDRTSSTAVDIYWGISQ